MESGLFWSPAPPDETRVMIRVHPSACYRPRQLVPGDYIFFTQERIELHPGESKPLVLDADVSVFGYVNWIEWPLPGYPWYHPAMGKQFSNVAGYHRLFEGFMITNVHDHPVVIEEGTAVLRIIMDTGRNADYPGFDNQPHIPSVPLLAYRNYTSAEATRSGPGYYTNVNLAPYTPLSTPLGVLRSYTNASSGSG